MDVNEDSEGRAFIKADFDLNDIRQVYNAINFYLQNGNQEDDEYKNLLRIIVILPLPLFFGSQ